MKKMLLLAISCFILSIMGCSSTIDISDSQYKFRQGNYSQAYQSLLSKKDSIIKKQGPIIMNLDAGILLHHDGEYSLSNTLLSSSERDIQEAYTESISANVASYIINDNTKEYQGEAYEDIYINIFKALNYLHLGEQESAFVELNRSIEKQSLLKQRFEKQVQKLEKSAQSKGVDSLGTKPYSPNFSSSALAYYLNMIVAKGMGEKNSFTYSLEQITHSYNTQPHLYPFNPPTSLKEEEIEIPKGKARLHIIAFSGVAPHKEEEIDITYISNGNYLKIAYPVLRETPSMVTKVVVSIDNKKSFNLEKIESMSSIAIETFKASSSLAKLKSILRATLKAIGVEVYDNAIYSDENSPTIGQIILSNVLKIASFTSEQADVRSSHFLPSTAWVNGVTLHPGEYTVSIDFLDARGKSLFKQTNNRVIVKEGTTNIVEGNAPF